MRFLFISLIAGANLLTAQAPVPAPAAAGNAAGRGARPENPKRDPHTRVTFGQRTCPMGRFRRPTWTATSSSDRRTTRRRR